MIRFLSTLHPILPEEELSFAEMKDALSSVRPFVVFQPAIWPDLEPIAAFLQYGLLQRANRDGRELIWLVSNEGEFSLQQFERLISDFYLHDTLPELRLPDSLKDLELNEMLLLHCENLSDSYDLPFAEGVNTVYLSLDLPQGPTVHVFLLPGAPESIWNLWTVLDRCAVDWIVESHKGFRIHFQDSVLFSQMQSFKDKSLLPAFFHTGRYVHEKPPETFLRFHEEIVTGQVFRFYLCPWGCENPDARSFAEAELRREKAFWQRLEENRASFSAFKRDLSSPPPLPAMRELYASLRELRLKDGWASDFYPYRSLPSYDRKNDAGSGRFSLRVELFAVAAALSLFEDTPAARSEARAYMNAAVHNLTEQNCLSPRYPDPYFRHETEEGLRTLANAIYDDVKLFRTFPDFAKYIGSSVQNLLEEALLTAAYARNDQEFADWLIENNFYGFMQPALYYIIYEHDKEKADALAKRLTPQCISWILADRAPRFSRRRSPSPRPGDETGLPDGGSEPLQRIFGLIDRETASQIKHYLKKSPQEAKDLYAELMEQFFGS